MDIGHNGIQAKWYWSKWYSQNGTDKMVFIVLNIVHV